MSWDVANLALRPRRGMFFLRPGTLPRWYHEPVGPTTWPGYGH